MDFGIDEQFVDQPDDSNYKWLWLIVLIVLIILAIMIAILLYFAFRDTSAQAIGTKCTDNADCTTNNCSQNYCQFPNTTNGGQAAYCDIVNGPRCNQGLICLDHTCQLNVLVNGSQCQSDSQCRSNNCSLGYCQARGIRTGAQGAYCQPIGDPGCIPSLECDNNTCTSQIIPPTPINSCPPNMILMNGECYPLADQPCADNYCGKGSCEALSFLYQLTDDNWAKQQITPGMINNLQSSSSSIWAQTKQGVFELKRNKPNTNWNRIIDPEFKIYTNGRSYTIQLKSFRIRSDNELMVIGTLTVNNTTYDGLFLYMARGKGRERLRPFNTWDTSLPGSQGVRIAVNAQAQILTTIIDVNFQPDETQQWRMLVLTDDQLYYTLTPLNSYLYRSMTQPLTQWIWPQSGLTFQAPIVVYETSFEPSVIIASANTNALYVSGSQQQNIDTPGMVTDLILNRTQMGDQYIVIIYEINDNVAQIARWNIQDLNDNQWVSQPGFYNINAKLTTQANSIYLSNLGICFQPRGTNGGSNGMTHSKPSICCQYSTLN